MTAALEHVSLIVDGDRLQEAQYAASAIASEFPSVAFEIAVGEERQPHLRASEWTHPQFDFSGFDDRIDDVAAAPFTLVLHDNGDRAEFSLEVLNRCQRLVERRNEHSQTPLVDRVLRLHRGLHDLAKPLVRAD